MHRWIFPAVLAAALGLAGNAVAGIYKWVDDEGNVQYTQKPPPDRPAETIKPRISTGGGAQPDQPQEAGTSEGGPSEEGQASQPDTEQVAMEQKAQMEKNCQIARQNLKLLESGVRVQVRDEGGNPVILEDEQIQQKIAESRRQVETFCQ